MTSDPQQQQSPAAPRPQTWSPAGAESAATAAAGGNGSAAAGANETAAAPPQRPSAEYEFPPRLVALTDRPIFIVGCPRSGTTWVQRLLVSDPRIAGGQESHFFTVFGGAMESTRPAKPGGRVVGLRCYWDEPSMAAELLRLWRLTMRPVVDAFPAADVLIEKTPDHATEIHH